MRVEHLHYPAQALEDIFHINMNHHQPPRLEESISLRVIGLFGEMTFAINFNHYVAVGAIKVHDIVANNLLSIKVVAPELAFFYLIPKQHFR